jgi:hypothetical protein
MMILLPLTDTNARSAAKFRSTWNKTGVNKAGWRRVVRRLQGRRDVLVAGPRIGSQQNLRALELARRMLASAQKRREFATLHLAEFDLVAYIHLRLLKVEVQTNN